MLKSIVCAAMLLSSVPQVNSPEFHVERVTVSTKYDSRYILRLANQLVPPDKLSKPSDIECLINELKISGLFTTVKAELRPGRIDNYRELDLTVVYHPQIANSIIGQVVLDGFPEVDSGKFLSALTARGIAPGVRFLKYPADLPVSLKRRLVRHWLMCIQIAP